MKLIIELDFQDATPNVPQLEDAVRHVAAMIDDGYNEGELLDLEPAVNEEDDFRAVPYRGWWSTSVVAS